MGSVTLERASHASHVAPERDVGTPRDPAALALLTSMEASTARAMGGDVTLVARLLVSGRARGEGGSVDV